MHRRFCSILWHEYQRALGQDSTEDVVLPHPDFSAACARLFDSLDVDGSGTVDFVELSSGQSQFDSAGGSGLVCTKVPHK